MSDVNKDELLANFTDITGVGGERARFYLEAANWQLETAMSGFYEAGGDDDVLMGENPGGVGGVPTPPADVDAEVPTVVPQGVNVSTGTNNGATSKPNPPAAKGSGSGQASSNPGRAGGMATMDSIRRVPKEGSDDEEKGQAFYAGGSEHSGQQVLGPPPKKQSDLVADMFKKAREHGAEEVNVGHGHGHGMLRKPGTTTFSGTGYKLGESSGAGAEVVPGSSSGEPEQRQVVLRLWSTGFTLDDGPLRQYVDPANREFLDSVRRGEIPKELLRDHAGVEVDVTMEDRHHEEYVPPKATAKPFFGKGNVLGSPVPATVVSSGPSTVEEREANETAARSGLGFRESEPSTNIQIRLSDGTRLAVRVNHTHTIGDLHNFINTARPQFSSSNYILTLFPNTELTQKEVTVKEANLFNSALVQKLK